MYLQHYELHLLLMPADSRAQGVRRRVIALARQVYAELGWGWREDVYREALTVELTNAGFQVSSEVAMPVIYRGNPLSHVSVRWDMVVDKCVLVELKAVQHLKAGALRQCERYASIAQHSGYLCVAINFPDKPKAVVQANF